jgi:lambda repressor-like predicted transcriptional regulator
MEGRNEVSDDQALSQAVTEVRTLIEEATGNPYRPDLLSNLWLPVVDLALAAIGPIAPVSTNAAAGNTRKAFIRSLLDRAGLSVNDWATKAKVDYHTADNYLKGKAKPYPATLKKLADALNVEVAKLPA